MTAERLGGQRANAGPKAPNWEVWGTLGSLKLFSLWLRGSPLHAAPSDVQHNRSICLGSTLDSGCVVHMQACVVP